MDLKDAIAVVGIACKFPGANDIDEFWEVLVNGENHVREVPNERWSRDAFFSKDHDEPGKTYVNRAALIDRFNEWDNRFFGINDDEAARMDPQHYLLLECAYKALENGGFPIDKLEKRDVGCFVGIMVDDYRSCMVGDKNGQNNYTVTSFSRAIAANRISYTFNFTGPSVCLDTACSSSLVAIHMASQAIRAGDCEMAVCGGVNVILDPTVFITLCKAKMLSPTGQCQPFSSTADGYARGEGCGIVVLKSLGQAINDKDRIWGVIGTGSNQDGHFATPITAPSAQQQEELMRKVYTRYHVDPSEISYIEAHGTGTPVGDPIEASALGKVIGQAKNRVDQPCYMGSVKSNIAHLESAAGVAGLIKVLLMMKNKQIVPSLHFNEANERIDLKDLVLEVPTQEQKWKALDGKARLACVNSFGFGGTNAHAIVMEYKEEDQKHHLPNEPVLLLSAKSKPSLQLSIQHLQKALRNKSQMFIDDLSYTSTVKRSHYNYRVAVHAKSLEELNNGLQKAYDKVPLQKPPSTETKKRIIFTFSGMGTHWRGMGIDFIDSEPVFRETLQEIDDYLTQYTKESVTEALRNMEDTKGPITQITLFAVQVALSRLLSSWGITPDAVVGHSVGEVAAMVAAGKFSLSTGVKVIFHRSQLLWNVPDGKMIAIGNLSREKAEKYCEITNQEVEIAAINSATSFTLSGNGDAILKIQKFIKDENEQYDSGIFHRILGVKTAFHSQHTECICEDLQMHLQCLDAIDEGHDRIELYSTVMGALVSKDDVSKAEYWKHNVRQTVLFMPALSSSLKQDKMNLIIEISPKPVLQGYIKDVAKDVDFKVFPTMKEGKGKLTLIQTLCQLVETGIDIDWRAYYQYGDRVPIELPRHQFNRRRHWYEPESYYDLRMGIEGNSSTKYPLVTRLATRESTYKCVVTQEDFPYVYDHIVDGAVVLPGAVYAELAMESWLSFVPHATAEGFRMAIEFLSPLQITQDNEICIHFKEGGSSKNDESCTFSVTCGPKPNAIGKISMETTNTSTPRYVNIQAMKDRCDKEIDVAKMYDDLAKVGYTYGTTIRCVSQGWKGNDEALSILTIPEMIKQQLPKTVIHPVILDGMLQTISVPFTTTEDNGDAIQYFPVSIGSIEIMGVPEHQVYVYLRIIHHTEYLVNLNAVIVNPSGQVVVECTDILTKSVNDNEGRVVGQLAYEVNWHEVSNPVLKDASAENINNGDVWKPRCVVYADNCGVATELKDLISEESIFVNRTASTISPNGILSALKSFDNRLEHVFYFWGITENLDKASEKALYDHILSTCISLQTIITYLAKSGAICPLTVVTMGVQTVLMESLSSCTNDHSDFGLGGAALWGMIRCLLRESTYDSTILVDLENRMENVVHKMGSVLFDGQQSKHNEFIIIDNTVYVNKLARIKPDKSYFEKRVNGPQQGLQIKVMSRQPSSLDSVALMYKSSNNEDPRSESAVTVRVQRARLHHPTLFPVTKEALLSKGVALWPEVHGAQHSVFVLDCVGEVLKSDSGIMPGTTVQLCCPVELESEINVPKSTVVDSTNLPNCISNIPCLSLLLLVWEVLVKHANTYPSKDIIIRGNQEHAFLCQLLSQFGSIDYCLKTSKIRDAGMRDQGAVVFVYCGSIPNTVEKEIMETLPYGSTVLNVVNKTDSSSNGICMVRTDIELKTVRICDLFQPNNLANTIPKVIKWLDAVPQEMYAEAFKLKEYTFDCVNEYTQIQDMDDSSIKVLNMDQLGPVHSSKDNLFHHNACYLVIGGTRGLGLEVVKYLSNKGAGYIAVLSRRPPEISMQHTFTDIEKSGTKIMFLQADVCETSNLADTLQELRKSLNGIPLKGVFHGAVSLADHLLINMTNSEFNKAIEPKILGTWNLHQLTINDPLDYFVLHSSVVSIFGNQGQTNYGAGNAFLDYLAYFRRKKGLPGQVINWSVLSIGVIETVGEVEGNLKSLGYLPLSTPDIQMCFEYAMAHNTTQTLFGNFQWSRISHTLKDRDVPQVRTRFENFIGETQNGESTSAATILTITTTHEYIRGIAASVLALENEQVLNETPLVSLGLDSIQAMTLQRNLKEKTSVVISMFNLLDPAATVSTIANYINGKSRRAVPLNEVSQTYIGNITSGIVTEDQAMRYHSSKISSLGAAQNLHLIFKIHELDIKVEQWQIILSHLMEKHPMLRASYKEEPESSDYFKVTYEIQEDFKPDVRELPGAKDNDDVMALLKLASKKIFDLQYEYPIRIFLAKMDTRITHVSLVVNHTACDFLSLTTLTRDFRHVVGQVLRGEKLTKDENVLSFGEFLLKRKQLLEAEEKNLRSFWKKEFEDPLDFTPNKYSMMLGTLPSVECGEVILETTPSEATAMYDFAKKLGITPFDALIGMYSILLHAYSHSKDVVVSFPVDGDVHVPKDERVIGCYVSRVLLRQTFTDQSQSVLTFLRNTGKKVKQLVENSLLPQPKISEYATSVVTEKPSSLSQHDVTWEEYTAFQDLGTRDVVGGFQYIDGGVIGINENTVLHIVRDRNRKILTFHGNFNLSYFNPTEGHRFFKDYKKLVLACISNPHLSLTHLDVSIPDSGTATCNGHNLLNTKLEATEGNLQLVPGQCPVMDNTPLTTDVYKGIPLKKKTKHGLTHEIILSVEGETGSDNKYLTWHSKRGNRRIHVRDVGAMKCYHDNGKSVLEVKTKTRSYIFESRDKKKLDNWGKALKELLE
ncbi:phthioceranic/hydroxyphthioceranic acid synthase-like [Glandiceps talaboti]